MHMGEFSQQMNRIMSTFGKHYYSEERMELIWAEVQHMSIEWMKHTADKFIGEHRQAPLLIEFREEICKSRERSYQSEKAQHTQEAEDSWNTLFMPDETKENFNFIRATLRGNTPPEQLDSKVRYFNHVAKLAEKKK